MAEDAPKFTSLEQVKTILSRIAELIQADAPAEDKNQDQADESQQEDQNDPEEDTANDKDQSDKSQTTKNDVIVFEAETEEISKLDEEMIAYSIAYPAKPLGWSDTQHDWLSAPEIRKMAHRWMIESGRYDIQHRNLNVAKTDATVVESFITPVDIEWPLPDGTTKFVSQGSWVVATKFSTDLWQRVKKGELNAYSIRGKGKRSPLAVK